MNGDDMLMCVVSIKSVSGFFYAVTIHELPLGRDYPGREKTIRRIRLPVAASTAKFGTVTVGSVSSTLSIDGTTIIAGSVSLNRNSASV